jgi:hypothetical protein
MSNGEFLAFVGLLAAAGLVLGVLAAAGFDQRPVTRVVDGVVAAGYLGAAAYLWITRISVPISAFAAGLPVLLLLTQLLRERARARRRRLAAGLTSMYVAPAGSTPLTPFPAPPPPFDPPATKDEPAPPAAPRAYRPMPSGLPHRGEHVPSPPPAHAEPTGPDTAPVRETSSPPWSPAYPDEPGGRRGGGRHQTPDPEDRDG